MTVALSVTPARTPMRSLYQTVPIKNSSEDSTEEIHGLVSKIATANQFCLQIHIFKIQG